MITLEDAKLHLRVDQDHDDELITRMINAAYTHIRKFLGEDYPGDDLPDIESAALILLGDLYDKREYQLTVNVFENRTFKLLLAPYVNQGVL